MFVFSFNYNFCLKILTLRRNKWDIKQVLSFM